MSGILQVNEISAIFHGLHGEQISTNIREALTGLRFQQPVEKPFLRFFVLRIRRLVLCAAVLFSAYIILGLISELVMGMQVHTTTLFTTALIGLSSILLSGLILRQAYANMLPSWFYQIIAPLVSLLPVTFSLMLLMSTGQSNSQTVTATIGLFYTTFLTTLMLRLRISTSLLLFAVIGLALLVSIWGTGSNIWVSIDLHAICATIAGVLMCAVLEFDSRCDFLSQAQIYHIATIDPLSKSLNRHAFFERGQLELDRARRYNGALTLLMLDIDHFKQVNDRFGHPIGDQVIASVGELSRSSLRSSDLLGRIGGEEFVVLLPDTDLIAALMVAERLRQAMERHITTPDGMLHVTISIGAVQLRQGEKLLQELIGRADDCLYIAKRSGRNRVVASEALIAEPTAVESSLEEPVIERAVGGVSVILTS